MNIQKLKNTAAVWIVLALSVLGGRPVLAAETSNSTGHWKTAFFKRGQMHNANDRGVSWDIRVEGCKPLHIGHNLQPAS